MYGIGVAAPCLKQMTDDLLRTRRMAGEKIAADEVAVVAVGVTGFLIHVKDNALGIAHGDGAVHFLSPGTRVDVIDFHGN